MAEGKWGRNTAPITKKRAWVSRVFAASATVTIGLSLLAIIEPIRDGINSASNSSATFRWVIGVTASLGIIGIFYSGYRVIKHYIAESRGDILWLAALILLFPISLVAYYWIYVDKYLFEEALSQKGR